MQTIVDLVHLIKLIFILIYLICTLDISFFASVGEVDNITSLPFANIISEAVDCFSALYPATKHYSTPLQIQTNA